MTENQRPCRIPRKPHRPHSRPAPPVVGGGVIVLRLDEHGLRLVVGLVDHGEGGVVQFLYGEDALDPTKASYLDCTPRSFEFMARNHGALTLQNTPLPGSSIDIAAADSKRSDALASEEDDSL